MASFAGVSAANPIDASWNAAVGGEWTAGANWSTSPWYPSNGAPALADTYNAVFGVAGAKYTAALHGDVTINELRLQSADATVSVAAGQVLTLTSGVSASAGSLAVSGTLRGGTISGDAKIPPHVFASNGGTYDGVTVASAATLSSGGIVKNGMAFAGGTLHVFATTGVTATTGDQTWSGNGTVALPVTDASLIPGTASTLTLGPGIRVIIAVSFSSGSVRIGGTVNTNSKVVLEGTISADGLFKTISLNSRVLNHGLIEAKNMGSITAGTIQSLNYSAGTLSGGTWAVYADSTMTPLGQDSVKITTNDANIILSGVNSKFGSVNFLATNLGTFTVRDGRTFTTAGALTNSGALNVGAGSTVTVAGTLASNGGSIGGDGALVTAGASLSGRVMKPGGGALRVNGTLDIAGGAGLDLTSGQLVLDYSGSSEPAVAGWVRSAYDAGAAKHWGGPGIGSSVAAADKSLAVAWGEAADVLGISGAATATWHGQVVDATSVLVALTLGGDADLNGSVDLQDLGRLAEHFGGAGEWASGDFTFDAAVDFNDLVVWAGNYRGPYPVPHVGGGPAGFDDQVAAAVAAVPEPGAALGAALAMAMAMRRRARRTTSPSFTERD